MHKMKNITGRFAAAAASAVLAVTAVGAEVLPAVLTAPVSAAGQTDYESFVPKLSMGLSAGGTKIGITFYIEVEGDIADHDVLIDGEKVTPEWGKNGWEISADEFAMNMNKKHSIRVFNGSNLELEKDISVSDYLHSLLADSEYSSYHALAKAMLRYGGAAQAFFDVDADSPVDEDIEGADYSSVTVDASAFDKEQFNSQLSGEAVSYYGMNLSLRAETKLSLFFKVNEDANADEAEDFLCGFKFNDKAVSPVPAGDGFFAVSLDVPAKGLEKNYTLTNGTVTAEFSPAQYIAAALAAGNEKLAAVCKALYAYGKAADSQGSQPEADDPQWLLEAKGTVHSGEATYYDLTDDNLGNAMLNDVRGEHYYAAMNTEDYNTAMLAGAYVEVTGPKGSVDVYIVDRLPEGKKGDLDLDPAAFEKIADKVDGRVQVTWKIIPFDNAAEKNVSYRFKNNKYNKYFSEVQVLDHKYPIYSFEVMKNGEFVNVQREEYNYFKDTSGFGDAPYTFRLTDIYGHVIIDENVDLSSGAAYGGVQFPD